MMNWQHSGFNIYCGQSLSSLDEEGIERLSQYIIRAPISQERIIYIPEDKSKDGIARVVYEGKTSGTSETFTALDWAGRRHSLLLAQASRLARLVTHIPNKGEQVVRYYGFYSNKSRGMRKKDEEEDKKAPDLVESNISAKAFRKNWARLIQKVYHVDPLLCPKCGKCMKIVAFIEDHRTIKKILKHLNLWMPQNHDPPPEEEDFVIHLQQHRSFEWWEALFNTSYQQNNSEGI